MEKVDGKRRLGGGIWARRGETGRRPAPRPLLRRPSINPELIIDKCSQALLHAETRSARSKRKTGDCETLQSFVSRQTCPILVGCGGPSYMMFFRFIRLSWGVCRGETGALLDSSATRVKGEGSCLDGGLAPDGEGIGTRPDSAKELKEGSGRCSTACCGIEWW